MYLDHARRRIFMLSCFSGHGVVVGDQEIGQRCVWGGGGEWGNKRVNEYAKLLFIGVHNLNPTLVVLHFPS